MQQKDIQKNATPEMAVVELYQKFHKTGHMVPVISPVPSRPVVTSPLIHRPGLALAGFISGFPRKRIQLIGKVEQAFLKSLNVAQLKNAWKKVLTKGVPAVIFSNGILPDKTCVERAQQQNIPLFRTTLSSDLFRTRIESILFKFFSPQTYFHGTLVDVHGVGMIFTGNSGVGKSECALGLIRNGHRLIADDMVHIIRRDNRLVGYRNETLQYHMEIRGIGIVDIRTLFGVQAVLPSKQINVQIELVSWTDEKDYERVGLSDVESDILGIRIPKVTMPVSPGKNVVSESEVIAMNTLLKMEGINSAQEFNRNLILSLNPAARHGAVDDMY